MLLAFFDFSILLNGGKDRVLESLNENEVSFNLWPPFLYCFNIVFGRRLSRMYEHFEIFLNEFN